MIRIEKSEKSETADTRTCDFANVTRETLGASSAQHIGDVRLALGFFAQMLHRAAAMHDVDKLTDLDSFHADFITGFKTSSWWERHRTLNRHHLANEDGVPADVNLIDVLDYVADCVMAGMARSGEVYPLSLPPELLATAFQNTVALLTRAVVVDEPPSRARQFCQFTWSVNNGPLLRCDRDPGHTGDHHNADTGFAAENTAMRTRA
jgi:hypothetical protein